MTTAAAPGICTAWDPLDIVLATTPPRDYDLIVALLSPDDINVPAVTTAQLRAALVQIGQIKAAGPYETTESTAVCPACGSTALIDVETGPCPIHEGQTITTSRWVRHAHPDTRKVCCPVSTTQVID